MAVIVAVERELDQWFAVARAEPAIDPGADRDHSEAADALLVELDERGLNEVERVLVPKFRFDDVPRAFESLRGDAGRGW